MLSCAVIGCGPAGMSAAAALRQCGLMVTCFEVAQRAGGIWSMDASRTHTDRGLLTPIHPAMRCAIHKDLMAFSDAPMMSSVPQFPHHSALGAYLHQYAESKGVNAITRFNTKVESVRFDEADGVWRLLSVHVGSGDVLEWVFDRVVVAVGQTAAPRYPEEARMLQTFGDRNIVTHSAFVKHARDFARKRVVVVGDGVSAYELCGQLSAVGASVVHSSHMALAEDTTPSLLSFDALTSPDSRRLTAAGLAASLPGFRSSEHHVHEIMTRFMRNGVIQKAVPRVGRLRAVEGDDLVFAADPTRRRTTRDAIEALEGGGMDAVRLQGSDERVESVDAVIFATGFHQRYPFLPPDMRGPLEGRQTLIEGDVTTPSASGAAPAEGSSSRGLYRGCLWANNPTIGVVGALPDTFPPFLLMEAQSAFLAVALGGKVPVPAGPQAMSAADQAVAARSPALASYFPPRGLGLYSSDYYNLLRGDTGSVSSVPCLSMPMRFSEAILRRKWWFVWTWLVDGVNRLRAAAPLKRRQQHVLVSNRI